MIGIAIIHRHATLVIPYTNMAEGEKREGEEEEGEREREEGQDFHRRPTKGVEGTLGTTGTEKGGGEEGGGGGEEDEAGGATHKEEDEEVGKG